MTITMFPALEQNLDNIFSCMPVLSLGTNVLSSSDLIRNVSVLSPLAVKTFLIHTSIQCLSTLPAPFDNI